MDAVRKVLEAFVSPLSVGIEYAVRIGNGNVLKDGVLTSRSEQEKKLTLCRAIWPESELVRRNVYYGEWKSEK